MRSADPPKICNSCEDWNKPQTPFRIFGNTYYVGVHGLSTVMIDGGDGLILLDGGLSQSAPL
ncbi:MAG TPA: subclass B3 metallo-beta-lactamase, partial [Pseudomonadota bacterium]|nr:subclass B3 metallo-beta-lactamase [Pseudomonadota bacterium]